MPTRASIEFEDEMREVLPREANFVFPPNMVSRIVDIGGIPKSFDFVSSDGEYIGDAKYYSMRANGGIPHGKLATITEYVWLLEKTTAEYKFIVFGLDIRVPNYWLNRYGKLTKVAFYFYDEAGLKRLH
jgi:hypothetical protein